MLNTYKNTNNNIIQIQLLLNSLKFIFKFSTEEPINTKELKSQKKELNLFIIYLKNKSNSLKAKKENIFKKKLTKSK